MTTRNTEVTTGKKIGVVAVLIIFMAIGGFFGFLAYSFIELFTRVSDPVFLTSCVLIAALLAGAFVVMGLAKGARRERRRIETSGGSADGMDFTTLMFLGAFSGGGSDGSGGGGWGGDGGGSGGDGGGSGGGGE
jgi:hypothetical protein